MAKKYKDAYGYHLYIDGKQTEVNVDYFTEDGGASAYAEAYPGASIRMRDENGKDYNVPLEKMEYAKTKGLHPFRFSYKKEYIEDDISDWLMPGQEDKPAEKPIYKDGRVLDSISQETAPSPQVVTPAPQVVQQESAPAAPVATPSASDSVRGNGSMLAAPADTTQAMADTLLAPMASMRDSMPADTTQVFQPVTDQPSAQEQAQRSDNRPVMPSMDKRWAGQPNVTKAEAEQLDNAYVKRGDAWNNSQEVDRHQRNMAELYGYYGPEFLRGMPITMRDYDYVWSNSPEQQAAAIKKGQAEIAEGREPSALREMREDYEKALAYSRGESSERPLHWDYWRRREGLEAPVIDYRSRMGLGVPVQEERTTQVEQSPIANKVSKMTQATQEMANEASRQAQRDVDARAIVDATVGDQVSAAVAPEYAKVKDQAEQKAMEAYEGNQGAYSAIPNLSASLLAQGRDWAKNTDLNTVIENVVKNVAQQDVLANTAQEYMQLGYDAEAAQNMAINTIAERAQKDIYQAYKDSQAPSSTLEYILGNAVRNSIAGMIAEGAVEDKMKVQLRDEAYAEAGEKQGMGARVASGVGSLLLDAPVFAATGGVGNVAAQAGSKAVSKGVAKMALNATGKLGTQAGSRYFGTSLTGRMLQGSIASGTTLGLYDGLSETTRQLRTGEMDLGAIANRASHGYMMGAMLGPIGQGAKYLSRNMSKAGKMATSAGAFVTEAELFNLGGLVSAGQEINLANHNEGFAESAMTLLLMKGSHKLPQVGKVFTKQGRADIREAINARYNSPDYMSNARFTKEDEAVLRDCGYDIKDLFKVSTKEAKGNNALSKKAEGNAIDFETATPETIKKQEHNKAIESETEFLETYARMMKDANVPMELKAKMALRVEGKVTTNMPLETGATYRNENGRYVVETLSPSGEIMSRRYFDSESKAKKLYNDMESVCEANSYQVCERVVDASASEKALNAIFMRMGNGNYSVARSIAERVAQAGKKNAESRTEQEQRLLNDFESLVEEAKPTLETSARVREAVERKSRMVIADILSKPANKRSLQEVSALAEYRRELEIRIGVRERAEENIAREAERIADEAEAESRASEAEQSKVLEGRRESEKFLANDTEGKVEVPTEKSVATIEDVIAISRVEADSADYMRRRPEDYAEEIAEAEAERRAAIDYREGKIAEKPDNYEYWADREGFIGLEPVEAVKAKNDQASVPTVEAVKAKNEISEEEVKPEVTPREESEWGKANGLFIETQAQAEARAKVGVVDGVNKHGVHITQVEKRANELGERTGVKVKVRTSIEEVEHPEARAAVEAGKEVTGWYNTKTGEVEIYAPEIMSQRDLDQTYVHEVVSHKGIEELLGKENAGIFYDKVYEFMTEEQRARYEGYTGVGGIKDRTKRRRAAASEFVAKEFAEKEYQDLSAEERRIWDRIVTTFQELLNKILGNNKLTREDIVEVLRQSYRKLRLDAEKSAGATSHKSESGVTQFAPKRKTRARSKVLMPSGRDVTRQTNSVREFSKALAEEYADAPKEVRDMISLIPELDEIIDFEDAVYSALQGLASPREKNKLLLTSEGGVIGVAEELGLPAKEIQKSVGMNRFATLANGGISLQSLAERIAEEYLDSYTTEKIGSNEVRDVLIDALYSASQPADIAYHRANRRINEAQKIYEQWMRQEAQWEDEYYMSAYGVTKDVYESYSKESLKKAEKEYSKLPKNYFEDRFADEEYNKITYGKENRTINEGYQGINSILPKEQFGEPERAGEGEGRQGVRGASSEGVPFSASSLTPEGASTGRSAEVVDDKISLQSRKRDIELALQDVSGIESLRADINAALEQYGNEESIPIELRDELLSRQGKLRAETRALYDELHAIEARLRDIERSEIEAERARSKEESKEAREGKYSGFLLGKKPIQQGRIDKVLSQPEQYNGEKMTRAEFIERLVDEGLRFEPYSNNGKLEYVANADERGMYVINKTEYEYALYLGGRGLNAEEIALFEKRLRYDELRKKYSGVVSLKGEIDRRIDWLERVLKRGNPNNTEGRRMQGELMELKELRELIGQITKETSSKVVVDDNSPVSVGELQGKADRTPSQKRGVEYPEELFASDRDLSIQEIGDRKRIYRDYNKVLSYDEIQELNRLNEECDRLAPEADLASERYSRGEITAQEYFDAVNEFNDVLSRRSALYEKAHRLKDEANGGIIQYSSRESGDRNLVGLHNLTESNLAHAEKMGGIANPSMAVVNRDIATLDNFGEITLIAPQLLIDKRAGKNAGTWGADAYSPRYPRVEYRFSDKAYDELFSRGRAAGMADHEISRLKQKIEDDGKRWLVGDRDVLALFAYEGKPGERIDEYVDKLVDGLALDERIFRGYTPMGNRRYVSHTLENVSRIMKSEGRAGAEGSFGMGSVRATLTPIFKTIAQIGKNRDRIVSHEEFEKAKESLEERFYELSRLTKTGKYDYASEDRLGEAMLHSNPKVYLSKEYGIEISDAESDAIRTLAADLRVMPTEYFETKFERPVELYEFVGAVIPKDATAKTRRILKEAGIDYLEYDREIPGDRLRAVREASAGDNIRFNSREEAEGIIARAKAGGNYMKAPNSKNTHLSEHQWADVRTKTFKQWFGDWEKFARIEKLKKNRPIEISGNEIKSSEDIKTYRRNAKKYGLALRGKYINTDTGNVISLSKGSINEVTSHDVSNEQLQSIAAIPQIIESSIYITTIENVDKIKHPDVTSYDYYVCGLKINEIDYTVKAVVANSTTGERYYDHKLTQIEKGELISLTTGIANSGNENKTPFSSFKDKRLFSILQNNSSKVIDENGEPLVVYHGTTRDKEMRKWNDKLKSYDVYHEPFTIFKRKVDGVRNNGFFFSSDKQNAYDYGYYNYEVFLNLKNPLIIDAQGSNYSSIEYNGEIKDTYEWSEYAELKGYDGVIFKNVRDGVDYNAMQNPTTVYVAFKSNQIKSATENIGMYSDEKDIRFNSREDYRDILVDAAEKMSKPSRSEQQAYDKVKDDFYLTKDNATDYEWALMQSVAGKEYSANAEYKKIGDTLIRVKGHTANWDRFENEYGEPEANNIINVTVGDYENTDYRRNKGTYEEFVANHPEVKAVDIEIADGEYLGDALAKIESALKEKGISLDFKPDYLWAKKYSKESNNLDGELAFSSREVKRSYDNTEAEESEIRFRIVEDPEEVAWFEESPKIIGYRNLVKQADDSYRPPMADALRGNGVTVRMEGFKLGEIIKSEETPEIVKENGKVDLVKPNGLGVVADVEYNPYNHHRKSLVNSQFKQAWKRPDLVYVECEIPVADIESGYQADKAALPVGDHPWNGGNLILSRYSKAIGEVPWERVADDWVERFKDRGVEFDIVPPALLPILENRGVEILPPHKGMGKDCNDAYKAWVDNGEVVVLNEGIRFASREMPWNEGESLGDALSRNLKEKARLEIELNKLERKRDAGKEYDADRYDAVKTRLADIREGIRFMQNGPTKPTLQEGETIESDSYAARMEEWRADLQEWKSKKYDEDVFLERMMQECTGERAMMTDEELRETLQAESDKMDATYKESKWLIKEQIISRVSNIGVRNWDDVVKVKDIKSKTTPAERKQITHLLEGSYDILPNKGEMYKQYVEDRKANNPELRELEEYENASTETAVYDAPATGNKYGIKHSDVIDYALSESGIINRVWVGRGNHGMIEFADGTMFPLFPFDMEYLGWRENGGANVPKKLMTESEEYLLNQFLHNEIETYLPNGIKDYMEAQYVDSHTREVMNEVREWYDDLWSEMESLGMTYGKAKRDFYVTHIWDKSKSTPVGINTAQKLALESKPKEIVDVESYVATNTPYMRTRMFDSLLDGMALGLVPKYEDIADIVLDYGHRAGEAIENRKLVMFLKNLKVNGIPALREVGGRNEGIYTTINNNALRGYEVLKAIKPTLNVIFGPTHSTDYAWLQNLGKAYDVVGGIAKKIELSLSFFHHGALTETAISMNGPVRTINIVGKHLMWDCINNGDIPAFNDPELTRDAVKHLVVLGATQDYAAKDVQAFTEQLVEWTRKIHGVHEAAKLVDFINSGSDKILWDYLHDGLKIYSYSKMAKEIRSRAERENIPADVVEKMLNEAGQLVNDTFGGQHWELLGWSPLTVKWMRRLMLSPDWTISTMRQALAPIGVGQLYNDDEYWKKYFKEDEVASVRKRYGRAFWIRAAIFFIPLVNGINMCNRLIDEEEQKAIAEEKRKTNPDYKSPYEMAYPNGMKWYDYTMYGNTIGHSTHLFMGRYEDGSEQYLRWGKQFRELPEMLFGPDGFGFPYPLIHKIVGKMNPMVDLLINFASGNSLTGWTNQDMADTEGWDRLWGAMKYGFKKFIPFVWNFDASTEFKLTDLVMPSTKGFSRYKAIKHFKAAIMDDDKAYAKVVMDACKMNGLNGEQLLETAYKVLEAEGRKNMLEGVENLDDAIAQYDVEKNPARRKQLKNYIIRQVSYSDIRMISNEQAVEEAWEVLMNAGSTERRDDKYNALNTSEDVLQDWRLSQAITRLKKYNSEYNRKKTYETAEAYYNEHKAELDKYDELIYARRYINELKSLLGNSRAEDAQLMQEIRAERAKALDANK